jgi:hypothetical protein
MTNETARRLHADLDEQISGLSTRADPAGTDEPELEPYRTRLRSMHDAVMAQQRGARR